MTPPPAGAVAVPAPAVRPRRRVGGLPSPDRPTGPRRPPARPRRVSGPTRPSARTIARTERHQPFHLLDRLIRGRAWIAVVAFALIGIVAAQLWVVKLNVGIGRAIEHAATLQRENSTLAIEDSTLASAERTEQLASAQGMVPAPPGALHFDALRGPLDVRLAVAALAKPAQPQASTSAPTGTEASLGGAAGTEVSPSTATGEPASPEAATAQSAPTEPPTTAESASAPAGTSTAPSTTAASTPEPSAVGAAPEARSTPAATGGASEVPASTPASAPASPGGGTQAAPGG